MLYIYKYKNLSPDQQCGSSNSAPTLKKHFSNQATDAVVVLFCFNAPFMS